MKTAKRKPRQLRPHPVPLPADTYGEPRRGLERARRDSGYTSLRVSKLTAALLKRVQAQAKATDDKRRGSGSSWGYSSYYSLGFDELLHFDALERLGELPRLARPD
jgi:hypothetical protein